VQQLVAAQDVLAERIRAEKAKRRSIKVE